MNPQLERGLLATRRQFFGRTAAGIGPAALSFLLRGEGYGATAGGLPDLPPLRAAGQARHLHVPVRGAVADRPVRPQAPAAEVPRPGPARLGAQGTAHHGHDLGPRPPAGRRVALQVPAARPVGHRAERAAAAHRQGRRRHHPGQDGADGRPSTTIRRSPSSRAGSSSRDARRWARG